MNGKLEKLLSARIITFGTFMVMDPSPSLLYIFSTFTFKVLAVKRNLHKKEIVSPVLKGGSVLFYTLRGAVLLISKFAFADFILTSAMNDKYKR